MFGLKFRVPMFVILVSVTPIMLKRKLSSCSKWFLKSSRLRFKLLTLLCRNDKQGSDIHLVFLSLEKLWRIIIASYLF